MQDFFTSPSGFTGVSFPDKVVGRPKVPVGPYQFSAPQVAQVTDIRMAWMPTYPARLARLHPIHSDWTGIATGAVFSAAIAPVSWLPTLLQYLPALRLHQTFRAYSFDALSGEMMNAAVRMAWDPRNKAPLITRPRLKAESFFYVPPAVVIASGASCVEMIDQSFAIPALLAQAVAQPDLVMEALTRTDFIGEDLC